MGLTWEEVEIASAQDRHSLRQRVAVCIGDAGWVKVKVKVTAKLDRRDSTEATYQTTYRWRSPKSKAGNQSTRAALAVVFTLTLYAACLNVTAQHARCPFA